MRNVYKLSLVTFVLFVLSLTSLPTFAHHLDRPRIEACLNGCVAKVLAGGRKIADCISVSLLTRQIVGPAAREKTDTDLQPITVVVEAVLRERMQYYAGDFAGSTIKIQKHELSTRQNHVYGVVGVVRRANATDYEFVANGQFLSESSCRIYTLAVGPINVNRWLREQPVVDEIIKSTIRSWGY